MFQFKIIASSSFLKIIRKFGIPVFLTVVTVVSLLFFTLSNDMIFNARPAFGYGEAPGSTDVTNVISNTGVFTQTVTILSVDNNIEMTINNGTVGLTSTGEPLAEIQVNEMANPPSPPPESNIIGLTYDFGPDGATFNPPITITFTFNPDDIPAGVDPADLKIAFYDSATGSWVTLDNIIVDPVTNTISGTTGHFTLFTIIAHKTTTTAAPIPPPSEITTNWTFIAILLIGIVLLTIILWAYLARRHD